MGPAPMITALAVRNPAQTPGSPGRSRPSPAPTRSLAAVGAMALTLLFGVAAGAAAAPVPAPVLATAGEALEFGPFGKVVVYRETPHPAHVVLFVSGDGGWNLGVVDMARALASLDALVVGIDVTHYLKASAAVPGACTYAAADFEGLSQFVQKTLDYPAYVAPVLIGYSSGATLVYAVLAESPGETFAGAISLGFCPDLPLTKPLCKGSALEWVAGPGGKGVSFRPAKELPAPWIALQGVIDQVCDPVKTQEYAAQVGGGEVVMLPKVGHGFSVEPHWMPQLRQAFDRLVVASAGEEGAGAAARPAAGGTGVPGPTEGAGPAAGGESPSATAPPGEVEDLPLVELPAATDGGDLLAVIASGDGGWSGLDKQVGRALSAEGIPVVGWNSLRYYWHARTPDGAAADLARILRHYLAVWKRQKAILIGYSLGADVLPFLVNRLPDDLVSRVPLAVLIGASHTATFEFHVGEWLGGGGKNLPETLPEAEKIRLPRVVCFYGDEEKDTICPELKAPNVRAIVLTGGHHFGGDYQGIARRILEEARPPATGGGG